MSKISIHVRCRNALYPRTNLRRQSVPDDKVPWHLMWSEYDPPEYTNPAIHGQSWADPEIGIDTFSPKWNELDGYVNRKSYHGEYNIVSGHPRNPVGRTGLRGRGHLGRWGPNHAADPIVTRWKRVAGCRTKVQDEITGKPVLQFVAIQRSDSKEWAIPGGMVDPGEKISATLKREFLEEAFDYLNATDDEKNSLKEKVRKIFEKGLTVFEGYVDDPRNTDNAWMETTAMHFHDEDDTSVGSLPLNAGDDAIGVMWMDLNHNIDLYANHSSFLSLVAQNLDAHW